jgi:Ribbon-helix-helix domain
MKSLVTKRSIVIGGHKTSVSLEEPFWLGLKDIAHDQRATLSSVLGKSTSIARRAICRPHFVCSCLITLEAAIRFKSTLGLETSELN